MAALASVSRETLQSRRIRCPWLYSLWPSWSACRRVLLVTLLVEVAAVAMVYNQSIRSRLTATNKPWPHPGALFMAGTTHPHDGTPPLEQPHHGRINSRTNTRLSTDHADAVPLNTRTKGRVKTLPPKARIAIGLALTTRDLPYVPDHAITRRLPLFRSLLPSVCRTASEGYSYHFFIAFDSDDPHLTRAGYLQVFTRGFLDVVNSACPATSRFELHYIQCAHNRRPAWAQNDAMTESYLAGMDYFYRVNDDTVMLTPGWTELFVDRLASYRPPNVGVVGPFHSGGNQEILTYDFVHRTHIELFGFHYPRAFQEYYADQWISDVYLPGRCTKVKAVRLHHTMELGTRYAANYSLLAQVKPEVQQGRATVKRYVTAVHRNVSIGQAVGDKVIAMSLWGDSFASTWGAVRNAQLRPIFFADWTMRIYVTSATNCSATVPLRVVRTLRSLGADIYQVPPSSALYNHSPEWWKYLVADDPAVERFVLRDPRGRLSQRQSLAVSEWMAGELPVHCLRDTSSSSSAPSAPLTDSLWGAVRTKLNRLVGESLVKLVAGFGPGRPLQGTSLNETLRKHLWPKVRAYTMCHALQPSRCA